jgi:hypothetical protein
VADGFVKRSKKYGFVKCPYLCIIIKYKYLVITSKEYKDN